MQKTTLWALSALAIGSAVSAQAQEQGRVLSSTPIVQQVAIPRQVCGTETVYGGSSNSGAGAILGAVAGGALGNTIGGGTGRVAATALGVVGGALVGNRVEGAGHYDFLPPCSPALAAEAPQICTPTPGFDRADFHKYLNREIVGFFQRTL